MSNPLSLLRFNAASGHIWLDEQRMLLLHARALPPSARTDACSRAITWQVKGMSST